jgi:hypothetical protein
VVVGIPFGAGIQMLVDAQQRYARTAGPVYLRVKNFTESGDYLEVGVPYVATGTGAAQTGYTDILITPPPAVHDVSMHNIGLLAGRLNFGSRIFLVSHTFVKAQMAELKINDPYQVFRGRAGKQAVGLFYAKKVFSIEAITHTSVSATAILWKLVGNALEIESDSPTI